MAQNELRETSEWEHTRQDHIVELEQRYIKLLETKIANLEAQLPATEELEKRVVEANGQPCDRKSEVSASVTMDVDKHSVQDGDEKQSKPKESRYVILISEWNRDMLERVEKRADIAGDVEEPEPEEKPKRAFTFRKIIKPTRKWLDSGSQSTSSEVKIEFDPLKNLLGRIMESWSGLEQITELRSPFKELVYSWSEAKEEANKVINHETEDEKQARRDLQELLRIISQSSGLEPLDRYFKERDTFRKEKTIRFDALWTLYPPGTLILARPFLNELQVFFVQSCDEFPENFDSDDPRPFTLICYSFDWNGSHFNRVPFELKIERWGEDRKSIQELPFYPLEYYQETGTSREASVERLKQRLIDRGKKYREYCIAGRGKQMFRYNGTAYSRTGSGIFQKGLTSSADEDNLSYMSGSRDSESLGMGPSTHKIYVKGTTMVDFLSFFEYQSSEAPTMGGLRRWEGEVECSCPDCLANKALQDQYKYHWDKHPHDKPMDDLQYLLCPPRVLGYALDQKTWAQLEVGKLRSPKDADESTFEDKLQLNQDHKDLIHKSVKAHETGKTKGVDDFAAGKGKGLIILLYGVPGVGKTLTAESVAIMAGKPLFSVGVSDIGIEGARVEVNLQKVFDLAGLWEAVLLLDEADVFLEARGSSENDLRRNALVSVLLRVLEYYEGILILTTNRLKSFDIAVQSRIHLAIKYDDLSRDQKTNIFTSFLEQLHGKGLVENSRDIQNWVKNDGSRCTFNGRQIRNIVSTAMGIANADHGKLTRDHLSSVARQTEEFQKDLYSQEVIFRDRQIVRH